MVTSMTAMPVSFLICASVFLSMIPVQSRALTKFQKWQIPGYFRGFNSSIWDNVEEEELTLDDFVDLKTSGVDFVILQTQGFLEHTSPYDPVDPWHVGGLDSLVSFCRSTELYYLISVRSGPGRRDVWEEGEGIVPPSTIWSDEVEQKLYGFMLKDMAARYPDDSLFVGMDMIQEPNPYGDDASNLPVAVLDSMLQADDIDVNGIYALLIDSIRTVDSDLPLLVQSVNWSDPEYFSLIELQDDEKIVYNTHCYNPYDYSHADVPNSETYPGWFWVNSLNEERFWDRDFLRNVLFSPVRSFQETHGVPIILGEFGMQYPQNGGEQYLRDLAAVACNFGWPNALWSYRTDPAFNYELMGQTYWNTVLAFLNWGSMSYYYFNARPPQPAHRLLKCGCP